MTLYLRHKNENTIESADISVQKNKYAPNIIVSIAPSKHKPSQNTEFVSIILSEN